MNSVQVPAMRHAPMRRRLLPALACATLLLVASTLSACGDDTIEHATGPSDLVLRIETGGGFVPVDYNLTQLPDVSIYGDGTVIVTGPMIEIFPQPALPNLQQTTITQDALNDVLAAAEEAGLFANDVDYGTPGVTDVGTTTITINADGQTYVSSIYALGIGFDDPAGETDILNGLTPEQREARSAIMDFYATEAFELATVQLPGAEWRQYEFTSLAVFSTPVDPAALPLDEGIQPNRLDWPLDDLSAAGEAVQPEGYRKVIVTGSDLDTLRPLLDQATKITLWNSGGREYYLYFRPLLPDESDQT